jgi:hypothetical protein
VAGASARVLNRSVVAFDASAWTPPAMVLLDTSVAAEALVTVGFARLLPEDATLHTTTARVKATLGHRRKAPRR